MTGRTHVGSVWLHALGATFVLVIAALATVPGVAYLSDEGAGILQARQLSERRAWIYENPLPDLDPAGRAMPFPQGDEGEKGRAPYARHPLYPRLLQAADAVAGTAGYVGLSIAGTIAAATGAALVARRFRPSLTVPVLWATVLSPLFFDSLIVLAHTLAAAAATWAVLAYLHVIDGPGRRRPIAIAALFVFTALAAALRTEGLFVGLGVAVAGLASVRRVGVRVAVTPVVTALAAAALVRFAEGAFQQATLGGAGQGLPVDRFRSASQRFDGLVSTWLLPGERPLSRAAVFLVVGTACIGAGALLVRWGRRDLVAAGMLVVGAGAYVGRVVVGDPQPVPGLLIVFPVGFAAVWVLARIDIDPAPARAAAITAVVIVVAVLITQYPVGGGVEWGGRYFAVAIPLATVPLLGALMRTGALPDWAPAARRAGAVALVAATLATAVLAGATLRHSHRLSARLGTALNAAGRDAGPADVGRPADTRPVVVTTEPLVPQLLWPVFERYRWLVAGGEGLADVLERAAGARVSSLVLLTADPTASLAVAAPWYRARPADRLPSPVPVFVLEIR